MATPNNDLRSTITPPSHSTTVKVVMAMPGRDPSLPSRPGQGSKSKAPTQSPAVNRSNAQRTPGKTTMKNTSTNKPGKGTSGGPVIKGSKPR